MLTLILFLLNALLLNGISGISNFEECGGNLTDAEGVIRSPGFPNNYPDGIDCYWLISVSPGETITITTAFFDTQDRDDYLDIRDGDSADASQLGQFSGVDEDQTELVSSYNTMWLHFHSSPSVSYTGFEIYYTTAMTDCHAHYTEKSGVIHSPGWPDQYPNNAKCIWTINVEPGERIYLTTTKFDTQSSYDTLEIRDGKDSSADSLLKWDGVNRDAPEVVSSYNEVYIYFKSDASITYDGFEIHWTTNMTSCHASYTEDTGVLHSPGWPGKYSNNARCFWTISVTPGYKIYLNVSSFDTEDQSWNDYLNVWDGPNSGSTELAELYGEKHDVILLSSYNELSLSFQSNAALVFNGFEIFWSKTDMSECNHHFTSNEGSVHSPGWPGNYPNGLSCKWTITVTPGERITFITEYLDTEHLYDSLEVYDGADSRAPKLLDVDGRNQDVPEVKSSHHQLYIYFYVTSNYNNNYGGFKSHWTTNETECHADYTTNEGTLHSPGWPGNYPNNARCSWTITVTPGETIKFTTLTFDTADDNDYLEVIDGGDAHGESLLKWSGQGADAPEVVSTHHQLYICFRTNGVQNSFKGFQSTWTTNMTECHADFTEPSGVLQSPRWPERYPNNAKCYWTITTDPASRISLNFTRFDTEWSYDYLEIWDGPDSSAPSLAKLEGRDQDVGIITSSHHQLYLHFHTNTADTYDGFQLNWSTY